jgi:hypothetical protein
MPVITIDNSRGISPVQRKIAGMQDGIIGAIYGPKGIGDFTLHGGLGIERTVRPSSNRSTGDIDGYSKTEPGDIRQVLGRSIRNIGFSFSNFRVTGRNTTYATIRDDASGIAVKLEIIQKAVNGRLAEYVTVEGNTTDVLTITLQDMVYEKTAALLDRKEFRDLYDLHHLVCKVLGAEDIDDRLKEMVRKALPEVKDLLHEESTRAKIYGRKVPLREEMINELEKAVRN